VYVGGPGSIAVFKRDPTGKLTQLAGQDGCINNDGSDGCAQSQKPIPDTVRDLITSKNGKFLYAAASDPGSGAVLVYPRSSTGVLSPEGSCVNAGGTNGCAAAERALVKPMGLAIGVGNGGNSLYVAANGSNAIAVFTGVPTGNLHQLLGSSGCVSQGGTDGCTPAIGLTAPKRVLVYKTGSFVFAVAGDGVASFKRSKQAETLTQLPSTDACITETGGGGCAQGDGLAGASDFISTIKTLYVTGAAGDSVAQLRMR
jgi:hypothetical protein